MKPAKIGAMRFVDDGYPEAEDYVNNFIPLPPPPQPKRDLWSLWRGFAGWLRARRAR